MRGRAVDLSAWIARIRAKLWDLGVDVAETTARESQDEAESRGEIAYFINPPIDEGELVSFEAKIGIELPEDYRRFILDIGDGGFGPAYDGVSRLHGDASVLAEPFPLTEPFDPDLEWYASQANSHDFPRSLKRGVLTLLVDAGATELILNGQFRGEIWYNSMGYGGMVPAKYRERSDGIWPVTRFADWYEAFLDSYARHLGLTVLGDN
jgi:hypothetical protein